MSEGNGTTPGISPALSLEAWRAKQARGEDFLLPSGLMITLKKIGVLDLATEGKIPATLAGQVDQLMKTGQVKNITMDDFKQFAEMIDTVCRASLLGPEGLQVSELPYADRIAIFAWANESGGKLQPFRRQEAKSMDTSSPRVDVRPAAVVLPGSQPG